VRRPITPPNDVVLFIEIWWVPVRRDGAGGGRGIHAKRHDAVAEIDGVAEPNCRRTAAKMPLTTVTAPLPRALILVRDSMSELAVDDR